ncbi:MAG: translation initiation factor IF-2 [Anaerolineae bacterium]
MADETKKKNPTQKQPAAKQAQPKDQPAKQAQPKKNQPARPGQADVPQNPPKGGEQQVEGNARQPRQPASSKPVSPVKPGAAEPAPKPAGPQQAKARPAAQGQDSRQHGQEDTNEVYPQRVFEPDNQDTVPVRSGSRPAGGKERGRRIERNLGISSSQRPGAQPARLGGSGQSSSARPTGRDQRRGDTQRATEPSRPAAAQPPKNGNKGGKPQPKPQARLRPAEPVGQPAAGAGPQRQPTAVAAPVTEVVIPNMITVREFAERIRRSPIEIIKTLMNYGMMVPITESIDFDTAQLIGEELGVTVKPEQLPEPEPTPAPAEEEPKTLRQTILATEKEENLVVRPPVVVVLGHVDHGKTTLLDAIRETRVVEGEAGGITQHIGAYQVNKNDRLITFLDTPGHEAFTAMRARGAQVTDIAVLVVAADDGVMPQTKEAIAHVKAAKVPIIVALNKIDKPQANPERVKQELADNGVLVEEYGGDVICVPVSAKFRKGIGDLLESILLIADIEPQKANPAGECVGTVIESRLDKTRGPMATLLVQNGTLHVGDAIVTGTTYAKIRAMYNDKGEPITSALPSTPVQILGLADVPTAGDTFKVVADERTARALAAEAQSKKKAVAAPTPAISLESFFAQAEAGRVKELNLILKADVQGSIEPIVSSLEKLGDEKLKVKILHQATGNITESDVMLAVASGAIILGFSVGIDPAAQRMAEAEGVDIRIYNIIYNLIEDIQKALAGLLEPVYKEVVTGHAEVRAVFKISKVGKVAGCQVLDGEIQRGAQVRVKRGDQTLAEDRIATLKRYQEDVTEVKAGFECGVSLHNFNDFQPGDILEIYKKERAN